MTQHSYHYALIARAIRRLDTAEEEVSLDDLSAEFDMSNAHFQRLFSTWAGISPKQFLQFRRLEKARQLLRSRMRVIDVAQDAGLSGSGRLHDLFIRWEAMAPGDYARAGEGREIAWGWIDSPFGEALILATDLGICGIGFAADRGRDAVWAELTGRWPGATLRTDPPRIADLGAQAFAGQGVSLHLVGGAFRVKVWEALLQIPPGAVLSYGALARQIGQPGAARAVGQAVGDNPVALLIPCHRVIRASGETGGYRWGPEVKTAMLLRERLRLLAA